MSEQKKSCLRKLNKDDKDWVDLAGFVLLLRLFIQGYKQRSNIPSN
jgi:hypothetical protein